MVFVRADEDDGALLVEGPAEALAVDFAVGRVHDVEELLARCRWQRHTHDLL